ncbi:MAG: PAS domain-containing sensor histidine kinase, partial [Bacteroidales bacterium]|nr:PAS domain-containing sensor histidine kinase [Bacteroidales bacterium]
HLVQIDFSDTGTGIDEGCLEKIFQPFYSKKEKSTGMGLPICERIVNNHDGEITVESKLGQGTKFTIILPVKISSNF